MNRLLNEIGRSQRLSVLQELKRSNGLPVKELAKRLGMSYMGVKQHCLELQRGGYLDTWRNPKPVGRPEMLYRLTRKSHELFPVQAHEMLLQVLSAAKQLYGPTAPAKLLFLHFREKAEGYRSRLKGETVEERVKWFARLRDREGCLTELSPGPPLCIVERHSPIADLFSTFPEAGAMERELFERVLETKVRRVAKETGGLYECVFEIA
ncbi:MAG TPA: winged helix-turn-helix transcriptional regulator [Chthoniobacterales bacterium]|nr:winged helix-turn-helix transcriptional regulator [Chthoniobacterales bacterium]